ncbi:hypothetical protein VSAK1_24084 [Vibrio mediterranei AK1]|nr:hypothetical protein VSAK1_24084 [Vibrio mediterranei AK1]
MATAGTISATHTARELGAIAEKTKTRQYKPVRKVRIGQ